VTACKPQYGFLHYVLGFRLRKVLYIHADVRVFRRMLLDYIIYFVFNLHTAH